MLVATVPQLHMPVLTLVADDGFAAHGSYLWWRGKNPYTSVKQALRYGGKSVQWEGLVIKVRQVSTWQLAEFGPSHYFVWRDGKWMDIDEKEVQAIHQMTK